MSYHGPEIEFGEAKIRFCPYCLNVGKSSLARLGKVCPLPAHNEELDQQLDAELWPSILLFRNPA